ncbi:nucleotidyltransferase domain-containing protein [Hyphomicrobium sp.]|uniref:nucleotidyltransferase domain-containing protein n=1 Tax=Hyphomicrobium sp. TaxID=82 RepID=UPI002D765953|nr:nucleotidyltransferase family protein [Hyphomicrobium sp.]HET6389581.1 nucleotidyltransferase family protein [Hyphomicrobium sp.]
MKFSGENVTKVFRALEDGGVPVWIDGGWATDALLRKETREHSDLDLIIPIECIAPAEAVLVELGFQKDDKETSVPTRVVFRDSKGLQVDIHPVIFQADGSSVSMHDDDTVDQKYVYVSSKSGFSGVGLIDRRVVRCTTAAEQIRQKVERRYSPWSPVRIRADGVSADLQDIISLLDVFGGEGHRELTEVMQEAKAAENPVVKAAEQFCLQHVASLSAQHANLSAEHAELNVKHAELVAEHAVLAAEHTRLVDEHAALRARFRGMKRSISWRITAPMRRAGKWIGLGLAKLKPIEVTNA